MANAPTRWDVDSPVQAELFVLWLNGDRIELTGPCGAAPWILELGRSEHPVEVTEKVVGDVVGPPRLLHSTSWRRDRGAVILTFVVVIDAEQVGTMASAPIARSALARGRATKAPAVINSEAVIEHGLRHLAWLVKDDPVVASELEGPWTTILRSYNPEPFRTLG